MHPCDRRGSACLRPAFVDLDRLANDGSNRIASEFARIALRRLAATAAITARFCLLRHVGFSRREARLRVAGGADRLTANCASA